jgi:hypothetical protein
MFDQLSEKYPEISEFLAADAEIVHSPTFEIAVSKVISSSETSLTSNERHSLKQFLVNQEERAPSSTHEDDQNVYVNIINSAKKQKLMSTYVDLKYIPATSVTAERFFSRAALTIGFSRQSLSEDSLESCLFLYYNRQIWDISDVDTALKQLK